MLALDAVGDRARAAELFADIQHLRDPRGAYWTGWQFANQAHFPAEQSSWTAAAIILAADALSGATGGSAIFRERRPAVGGRRRRRSLRLGWRQACRLPGQPMPGPVRSSTRSEPSRRTSANPPDCSARR